MTDSFSSRTLPTTCKLLTQARLLAFLVSPVLQFRAERQEDTMAPYWKVSFFPSSLVQGTEKGLLNAPTPMSWATGLRNSPESVCAALPVLLSTSEWSLGCTKRGCGGRSEGIKLLGHHLSCITQVLEPWKVSQASAERYNKPGVQDKRMWVTFDGFITSKRQTISR